MPVLEVKDRVVSVIAGARTEDKRKNDRVEMNAGRDRLRASATAPKKAKRSGDEPKWHPNFGPDSVKVIFLSNDKENFSVDKEKLVHQR
jgi:hypothetical protein